MHTRSMATPEPGALFRTRTGQTGRDAYINEAAAIANAKRELDARFVALLTAMHDESPELFDCSSDYHPQLTRGCENAASLTDYVLAR